MKVLLINGSAKANGCTGTALAVIAETLNNQGIDTETICLGGAPIRDCIGCRQCKNNRCVFDDDITNRILEKAESCDGFVFGTPIYYSHPSGRILDLADRMFYSGGAVFKQKPAMAVASARRAGTIAGLDVLNKHFTINQMPVVSSTYWNEVHGSTPADVKRDEEGLETLENGARNLAWLLKCIDLGKNNSVLPPKNAKTKWTNFITD